MSKPERCQVINPRTQYKGKQELLYNVGISAETVGAKAIHMQLATIPPGSRAKAHKHEAHETAIYALRGATARTSWYSSLEPTRTNRKA